MTAKKINIEERKRKLISLPDLEGSPETSFFDLPEAFLFHSCYILVVPKQLFWIIPWEGRHQLLLNTSKGRWKGKVVEEEVLAADGRRWRLNEKKKKEDEREKGIKKNITDINSVPMALPYIPPQLLPRCHGQLF